MSLPTASQLEVCPVVGSVTLGLPLSFSAAMRLDQSDQAGDRAQDRAGDPADDRDGARHGGGRGECQRGDGRLHQGMDAAALELAMQVRLNVVQHAPAADGPRSSPRTDRFRAKPVVLVARRVCFFDEHTLHAIVGNSMMQTLFHLLFVPLRGILARTEEADRAPSGTPPGPDIGAVPTSRLML